MIHLKCLCGNSDDLTVVYAQNFSEDLLSPDNFSARGKHDYDGAHYHYRIVRCGKCQQLFSSPVLEEDRIEGFYRNSLQNYTDEAENIVRTYLKSFEKYITLLPGRETVLEVGCGSGFCLRAMRAFGFRRLIGVEPSTHGVLQAERDIGDSIRNCSFEKTDIDDNSVDLACAFQVLDHFLDPVSVVEKMSRILKPGGLSYVIIHDVSALQVKILREKSPIIDVSHIYYFDRETLERLFVNAGFEVVDTFAVWNVYTLRTWLRMLPVPLKSTMLALAHACRLDNMKLRIPAGNIGLIARKP